MDPATTAVDVSELDEGLARRVLMTVSCRDSDRLPKVDNAGAIITVGDDRSVQVMHNGVLIDEGCYFGAWMTEIIKGLAGNHEPQEEVVFDAIVRRIAAAPGTAEPLIIEFGSFWSYYSIWFCRDLPGGRAVAIEPDPGYLEAGVRNAELNGLTDRIEFIHGAVGGNPGELMDFHTESVTAVIPVRQDDLGSLLEHAGVPRIELAMVDIQGAETVLLERARDLLTAGRVRFMIVSTHHQTISGDPLTHQRALALLQECGAHVIAEHTVRESYSGDGLIAVGFDPADADLIVPISHARAADSLFGEPEQELAALTEQVKQQAAQLAASQQAEAALRAELDELRNAVPPTASAPASPESASPESTSPESSSPESVPESSSPEPSSPEPSSPESTSPEPSSPESVPESASPGSPSPESVPESSSPEATTAATNPATNPATDPRPAQQPKRSLSQLIPQRLRRNG